MTLINQREEKNTKKNNYGNFKVNLIKLKFEFPFSSTCLRSFKDAAQARHSFEVETKFFLLSGR